MTFTVLGEFMNACPWQSNAWQWKVSAFVSQMSGLSIHTSGVSLWRLGCCIGIILGPSVSIEY